LYKNIWSDRYSVTHDEVQLGGVGSDGDGKREVQKRRETCWSSPPTPRRPSAARHHCRFDAFLVNWVGGGEEELLEERAQAEALVVALRA
jgi:hypothetical protein